MGVPASQEVETIDLEMFEESSKQKKHLTRKDESRRAKKVGRA